MSKKSSKRRASRRFRYTNDHAAIQVNPNGSASFGGYSYTTNREDAFDLAIFTDSSNSTRFSVRLGGTTVVKLTGKQARAIQRLLNKHYGSVGRSTSILGAE